MADGDVLDSWEDQEDQGILDKRLEEIKVKPGPKTAVASVLSASVREDSTRTEFQPQVRILKRDAITNTPTQTVNNSSSAGKPMKSLEQREAEYAQARMRIFGSMEEQAADDTDDTCLAAGDRPISLASKLQVSPSHNAVARQPRGPDGSQGFNLAR